MQQWMKRYLSHGSRLHGHVKDTIRLGFTNLPARSHVLTIFFVFLLVGALVSTRLLNSTAGSQSSAPKPIAAVKPILGHIDDNVPPPKLEIPLNCSAFNRTRTCPRNYPTTSTEHPSGPTCPEYFRWIHEDLRQWAHTGISRDMLERAKRTANFRLVVVGGKAYVERFRKSFQSRDTFTVWGILQLLRKYPGKVPDLELMFDCVDWPVVRSADHSGPNAPAPPPLFRYCGDEHTLDIVFPDWSFWGWTEINIKPWESLLSELREGNKRVKWKSREPYAYWKGNPAVAQTRQDLMKCNVTETKDWNARVYAQDWIRESQQGYKQSDLANQCIHRYKIYIEGSAWSVSEKYILACNSVTLLVKPHYYDFFTRGLEPVHHFWPVKENDKCRSIKFAVDWGNTHKGKAQAIGKAASEFIQEELKMDYVYDYMFHLLNEYAKLLTFKPTVPRRAIELCSEYMACSAVGLEKKFMLESMVKGPANAGPCSILPPYDPSSLHSILQRRELTIKQVELWEKKFWDNETRQS
ncbi:hypothetical protein K2173_026584 [Erythroxylum novogranatense]|uniref:Glycosyl transferase CAP10 domain-containing protein n=1 Tax=Erythroxylum novogranatense TaxID=1862640 RepID=A0AAV8TWV5_9ROSI|nr:hypothetical protein K2173_026584 [Erythroxylum novogranatense]